MKIVANSTFVNVILIVLILLEYVASFATRPKVLISYVLYIPLGRKGEKTYNQCSDNIDAFVVQGVDFHPSVQFVFSLVGDTVVPNSITAADRKFKNVRYVQVEKVPVDLFAHGNLLRSYLEPPSRNWTSVLGPQKRPFHPDLFIFLNCGARGPYFHGGNDTPRDSSAGALPQKLQWITTFSSKLNKNVKAVGPTINCEVSPHVQSYALALDRIGASIVLPFWSPRVGVTDKFQIIRDAEVGISAAIMKEGYQITGLDSRYRYHDFRDATLKCEPDYPLVVNEYINPIRCDRSSDGNEAFQPGCEGVEPCEVIFVKYGGEVFEGDMIAGYTLRRVREEDKRRAAHQPACPRPVIERRRIIDIDAIHRNLSSQAKRILWPFPHNTQTVLLVRAHSSYSLHLISLLWTLEATQSNFAKQMVVLVIPTDAESTEVLRRILVKEWAFNKHRRLGAVLLDFPQWVYDSYGHDIETMCTPPKYRLLLSKFPVEEVRRHCLVNSPLHYLLVDIALHHVITRCPSCSQLVVTNADNHYSLRFFNQTDEYMYEQSKEPLQDVILTNMVSRGNLLQVQPERRRADLGCFLVSVQFLRDKKISFLSSLPLRPQANDYHDADGFFIEKLREKGARILIHQQYLFIHE